MLLLLLVAQAAGAHWPHGALLDAHFALLWQPAALDVAFELQVRTRGYVAFGFSRDGSLDGADLLLGWVQGSGAFLQDLHGEEQGDLAVDTSQDYSGLVGFENGTHTVLRFRRRYHTCDPQDYPITNMTMRILFGYGNEKPTEDDLLLRKVQIRGVRSIYLLQPPGRDIWPAGTTTWDIRNPQVMVSAKDEKFSQCKVFRMPNLRKKHHLIGYEPLFEVGNEALVQHMSLYACHGELEQASRSRGQPCSDVHMPPIRAQCTHVVATWSLGSGTFSFPPNAGYPLDPMEGPAYFLLETRYYRPDDGSEVTDSSGLRLYYTSSLRRHDAGVLSVGVDPMWRHIIPPGQPAVKSQGHCIPLCTHHALPQHGIHIFASLLHTHLIGRQVRLRHIRQSEELEPINDDTNYDFDSEQYRRLQTEAVVFPGDHLMTECLYNSEERSTITIGGIGIREEMCLTYVLYYPRTHLTVCHSLPSLPTVLHSLGIQELWQGPNPVMIKSPPDLANMTLETRLLTFDWENNFWKFQDATSRGTFKPVCRTLEIDLGDVELQHPNVSRREPPPGPCPDVEAASSLLNGACLTTLTFYMPLLPYVLIVHLRCFVSLLF